MTYDQFSKDSESLEEFALMINSTKREISSVLEVLSSPKTCNNKLWFYTSEEEQEALKQSLLDRLVSEKFGYREKLKQLEKYID